MVSAAHPKTLSNPKTNNSIEELVEAHQQGLLNSTPSTSLSTPRYAEFAKDPKTDLRDRERHRGRIVSISYEVLIYYT